MALKALGLLGAPAPASFDRLTRLAQLHFQVPISAISLVGADRQWFLSQQGLDVAEVPRVTSFCGHTILAPTPLLVPDATQDPRFADNPFVVGLPKIRLYAGYPLAAPDGSRVGTLCIMDHAPRALSEADQTFLALLAGMAQEELARVQANQLALKHSRFFTLSLDMLCIAGLDGYFKELNSQWSVVLGSSLEELKNQPFIELVHPDDREGTLRAVEQLSRGDAVVGFENRYRHANGSYRWISWSALAFPDEQAIFAIGRDITEQKAVVDRIRLMVEAAPLALLMVSAAGVILLANSPSEQLFGYSCQELTGSNVEQLLPARYRPHHGELRARFMAAPAARPMGSGRELYGLCKDGREIPLEIGLSPVETPNGTVVMVSFIDISERRRQQEVIREKSAALERSNLDLERFAYVVSHDLQEPMRKVQAFGDLLQDALGPALVGEAALYFEKMITATTRMRGVVGDLLALSQVTSGGRPFGPVALALVVQRAIEDLDVRIKDAQAQVTVGALPVVMGDEGQLRQLFVNLIGNAVKYRKPGVAPVVVIRAQPRSGGPSSGGWEIEVEDNGIGFDPRHATRIFEIFERLHARGGPEGTGIGLSIVRRIIERHNGTVHARSTPGQGAVFTLWLPAS